MQEDILKSSNLKKYFPIGGKNNKNKFVKAIDGIDFTIRRGETLGLVGESGSGKSTTAYTVIGMYGITEGSISYKGEDIGVDTSKTPSQYKKGNTDGISGPGNVIEPAAHSV